MSADLRDRIARAIATNRPELGDGGRWDLWCKCADAVLAELGLTQAEPVAWLTPGGDVSRSYAWAAERCTEQDPIALYAAPQASTELAAVLLPLVQWAGKSEPENHPWAAGYEAAREYVRMQLHATPQPQPQASAEDVALVDEAVRACIDECGFSGETRDDFEDAWQRIRADYERMGVSK